LNEYQCDIQNHSLPLYKYTPSPQFNVLALEDPFKDSTGFQAQIIEDAHYLGFYSNSPTHPK